MDVVTVMPHLQQAMDVLDAAARTAGSDDGTDHA